MSNEAPAHGTRSIVRNRPRATASPAQAAIGLSPRALLLAMALAIFVAEVFIMLLLNLLPQVSPHVGAVIDSALLVLLLAPAFLYLIYQPLRAQVTEMEYARQALLASEQRFRDVAAQVGEWVWEVDAEGRYTYASPLVEQILGYRPEEVEGQFFYDFFLEHEREQLKAAAFDVFAKKQSFSEFVNRNRHRDGRIVTLETSGLPLLDDDGQLTGYRGSDRDISERIRNEQRLLAAKIEAENASRAKSTFLANMSHELRTPLNGTLGMLDLLADSRLDATQREYVQLARDSADRLLRLIDQLLDYSRLESSELLLLEQVFDPHELVANVRRALGKAASEKGLRLDVVCHPLLPHALVGDPGHLGAVLEHLVNNAIKFTHQGHVRIEMDYQTADDGAGSLQVNVLDTGIGLPEGNIDKLFDEFTQGEDQPARRYGGTGLGLALC
ncbi:MAG TPA: histidine kinase dimerization/phospho-acceptor domain-containing protein, partial [Gammaproteobacteria bacterium]